MEGPILQEGLQVSKVQARLDLLVLPEVQVDQEEEEAEEDKSKDWVSRATSFALLEKIELIYRYSWSRRSRLPRRQRRASRRPKRSPSRRR